MGRYDKWVRFHAYLQYEWRNEFHVSGTDDGGWFDARERLGIGDARIDELVGRLVRAREIADLSPEVLSQLKDEAEQVLFQDCWFRPPVVFARAA